MHLFPWTTGTTQLRPVHNWKIQQNYYSQNQELLQDLAGCCPLDNSWKLIYCKAMAKRIGYFTRENC